MVFVGGFVSVCEVDSRDPAVLLICAFIAGPVNKVEKLTGLPIAIVIFGVRDLMEFLYISYFLCSDVYLCYTFKGLQWDLSLSTFLPSVTDSSGMG